MKAFPLPSFVELTVLVFHSELMTQPQRFVRVCSPRHFRTSDLQACAAFLHRKEGA